MSIPRGLAYHDQLLGVLSDRLTHVQNVFADHGIHAQDETASVIARIAVQGLR